MPKYEISIFEVLPRKNRKQSCHPTRKLPGSISVDSLELAKKIVAWFNAASGHAMRDRVLQVKCGGLFAVYWEEERE